MDESLKVRLCLIVSAHGFLGPANRRQNTPVCDQQTPQNQHRRQLVEGVFSSFACWRNPLAVTSSALDSVVGQITCDQVLRIFSIALPLANSSTNLSR